MNAQSLLFYFQHLQRKENFTYVRPIYYQTGMASSTPDDVLPPLTDEDIQTFVNKKTCDKIIPDVFSVVIAWGKGKQPYESFEGCIKRRRQITEDCEWKKFLKRFNKGEQDKLRLTSADIFDTTFCCKLMPLTCDGIEEMGSDAWKTKDESKVEWLMNELKAKRNAVMHEPKGAAIEKGIEDEILRLSLKLLEVAGQKYGVSSVDDQKLKLQRTFNDIERCVLSDKEKRLWRVRRKLLTDGKTDMKEKHLKFERNKPDEFKHIDKFYPLEMTSSFEGERAIRFPCTDLFSEMEEHCPSARACIIKGVAGSGKSSIITQMESQILECGSTSTFKKMEAFEVCLRVNCRESSYGSLENFVKDSFSSAGSGNNPSTLSDCGTKLSGEDMTDALRLMNLLVFIDGMDEVNAYSGPFVQKMIEYLKIHPTAKCIVTSRPHSTEKITDILDGEGIPYQTMEIEELRSREQQEEFLKSICTNGDEASKAFASLDLDLSCPVQLALFSYFYSLDPTSVNSWTSPIQMMKSILSHNTKSAVKTLEGRFIDNAPLIVKKIRWKICHASFISLYIGKLYLEKNFYEAIKESSFDSIGPSIPYDSILSSFMKPSKYHNEPSYQFYHKTHQELMAGTYLAKKMTENRDTPFTSWDSLWRRIFEKARAEEPTYNDLQEQESEPMISSTE